MRPEQFRAIGYKLLSPTLVCNTRATVNGRACTQKLLILLNKINDFARARAYIIGPMPSINALQCLPQVHEQHLDNGLKVLIQEIRTAPLVSVWCWYGVGSGDEAPGLSGISHWVEHMNFRGTRNIPGDRMKGIVERFGGMWNGYTWIDQTTYLETAGKAALDQMLFIEAERMCHSRFDPRDCESERTVIISELQGGENDPEQLLDME